MSVRPRFLGPVENDRLASPIHTIAAAPPPFLIAHGSKDFPHLITQAEQMEVALAARGGAVERIVLDGRDHFTASLAGGEADGPWVGPAIAWMAAR
jgi:arylformamidase